ncbi:MAG TPA: LysM peptidoglycan-binding domain-containing protein [Polyangiales bacterium]|nr:LysM peptidoglycan-binding domain-containing protein [Polyangiales bacterium]
MKRLITLSCLLALAAPALLAAQEAGEFTAEATDYSDYFGEPDRPVEEGPHSLGEARQQHRAYKLGQTGSVYKRPEEDIHTVQEGDTLWDISERYFGEPWHWPELWSYNPEITNPHWIYPLDHVRLSSRALDAAPAATAQTANPKEPTFKEPKQGMPDDLAPRVTVPAKMLQDGTVFLRDQGYLDDAALKSAGQIVAGPEEHMLLSNSDNVYVRFKPGSKVTPNGQYTIFRTIHKWERDPDEKGTLVRIVGTILLRSYDPAKGVARGTITESLDPVERGMDVALMDRRFDLVPPQKNERNITAHIIASVQPRQLLSYGNVVFIDVGEGHGIKPGNRFFVVRQGDNWLDVLDRPAKEMGNIIEVPPYKKDELPTEVVAELRVVKVRKNVTIALITRSDTDVFQGEKVEMRAGY